MIATLWLQLTDIYGSRFVNGHGEKDSGVWRQALMGLKEKDIAFGLNAMFRDIRFETWPPNCTQFRHLCINNEYKKLPHVIRAFREALDNLKSAKPVWSHEAIKFTVKYVGVEKVLAARIDLALIDFKEGYAKVCERISQGHQVPFVSDDELQIKKTKSQHIPRLSQILR